MGELARTEYIVLSKTSSHQRHASTTGSALVITFTGFMQATGVSGTVYIRTYVLTNVGMDFSLFLLD